MVNHIISYRRNCNHLLHLQDQHQQMYLPLQTHCSPRSPMCNFYQSVTFRFRNISIFGFSIRKKIGIDKIIGFGFGKIWYRKKFLIWFRSDFGCFQFQNFSVSILFQFLDGIGFGIEKNLVSKKVSVLLSEKFGVKKVSDSVSFRFWVSSHTDRN